VEAIRRCLAKDRDQRWQNARDLALELEWIADGKYQVTQPTSVPQKSSKSRWIGLFLAAGLFLLLIATGGDLWNRRAQSAHPMYFHASVPFAAKDLAVSPDGRSVAVAAYSSQLENVVVWKYEVGGLHRTYLEGTEGASFPFWSPDGRSIGFFAEGKLKKLDLASGQAEVLCNAPNGRGGSWNRDGVIIFTPDGFGGLFRVPSSGGSPVEISKPDSSRFETSHRWPVFLPDGKHFLYLAANFTEQFQNSAIFVGSLDSREKRFVVNTAANAVYAEPGYLLYMHDKILVAQSFDPHTYALKGEPHALDGGVQYFPQVYRASFSTSNGDVLVTQTTKNASLSQLAWFDRAGNPAGTIGAPAYYDNVRLSSDSSRIATDQTDPGGRNVDIWIHDPARGVATRLTFNPSAHQSPIWSPDNRQILFASNRKLGFNLYLKNADGSGSEQELADFHANVSANAWDWSRDGKYILVRKANELWYISWPEMSVRPLLTAKWTIRNAQFSPDGRWIAYTSNENGRMEVYVSPFPRLNSKWQVSTVGGQEPRWRQDGRELFYISPNGMMMAIAVKPGTRFDPGPPIALFRTNRRQPVSAQDVFSYDVTPDGKRFLVITAVDESKAGTISVALNWSAAMTN
jgi:Tol biopolymer transport system component